jgi:hypothetical protein
LATAKKTPVTRSSTINVKDVTFEALTEAKTKVGAPDTARIQTGGANYAPAPGDGTEAAEYLPYSITFTWTEDV